MRPTMADVARVAQVSPKTVSNVLAHHPHVREATRERVLAAIAELGYTMNVTARSLRSGRTGMISLALPELKHLYFAELADAVIVEAERRGLRVLIEQTGADRGRELEVLRGARRHLTDGTIFSPLALGQQDLDAFAHVDIPMVILGERVFGAAVDHVTMNNVDGARAATEHLLSLGRRRIAVIGAHEGEDVGSAPLRIQGYHAALTSQGVRADPRLLRPAGEWNRLGGAAATTALLAERVEFDAVFGLNDALALGALHVLHQHRIAVPRDVAVVGFDDVDDAQYAVPPLSSIDAGRVEVAARAVDLLATRLVEPDRPVQTVTTAFHLVERASTTG
ncbi:MAG: LacI family DNA-binding transcriptional regulator [Demequina sp.]|uniref:LacI family DNA-binding transcriptional regulator n=1 Tax=Demequina sp. TaxID=2050685 RepID=UPI003A8BBF14